MSVILQESSKTRSWAVNISINALGILSLAGIGSIIGYAMDNEGSYFFLLSGICFGVAIWIGIRLGNDLVIVDKMNYLATERLGIFDRIRHGGFHLLLLRGFVDRVPPRGNETIAYRRLEIYKGDVGAKIDFTDGSTEVTASIWYAVGSPAEKEAFAGSWNAIDKDILLWLYEFEDETRLYEIIDGFVRPRLQMLSIDEASAEKGSTNQIGMDLFTNPEIAAALMELGIWLDEQRPFILSDINIPQPLQDARQQRLVRKAQADGDIETGRGIRGALNKIRGARPSGDGTDDRMGDDEAAAIFATRTSQNVIERKSGDITFIAEGVGGLVRTLEVRK